MTEKLPERIMAGGGPGVGKTKAWLDIAASVPEATFHVIDPDDGVKRVWRTKDFADVKNVKYYFTPKWFTEDLAQFEKGPKLNKQSEPNCWTAGVADAWASIKKDLKKGDWVVVEHLQLLWDLVQSTFSNEVFGKSVGVYFLEARKALKDNAKRLDALQGWIDWPVINRMHNDDFVIPVCFDEPMHHVYMTTSLSMSDGNMKEDVDIAAFYGDTKIRLEGQKRNPFRMQSIILFKQTGRGKDTRYLMNTFIKDRGRDWMTEKPWNDFYFNYLVDIAGW